MQKDIPSMVTVGNEALEDVRSNFETVKRIIWPVIPAIIILVVIDTFMQKQFALPNGQFEPLYYMFSVLNVVITAWIGVHYIMRWHLFTLKGNVEHEGTWSKPDNKYKQFFVKSIVLQVLMIAAMLLPVLLLMISPVLGLILMVPIWFAGIYAACRLSFILPATVMGHTPSLSEIWSFAQGMVGKIFWAPLRVLWMYILAFVIYIVIVSGIIGAGSVDVQTGMLNAPSTIQKLIEMLLIAVPSTFFAMFFGLVYVGVLSRYYQWGLENRTDAYGDFK